MLLYWDAGYSLVLSQNAEHGIVINPYTAEPGYW